MGNDQLGLTGKSQPFAGRRQRTLAMLVARTSYRGTGTSTFDDPAIASIAAAHGQTPAQVQRG
jgi:diketogulonate reductase-like aldo/keto reductase